jgi:uncharacterized protein YcnI
MQNPFARHLPLLAAGLISLYSTGLHAHVSVTSTPHFAGSYSEFKLAIPHGCTGINTAGATQGFDTQKIEVVIDKAYGLEGIRPINSEFGHVTIAETDTQITLTWTNKNTLYATDSHAYNLLFRAKTPAKPFTAVYFPTTQYCTSNTGEALTAAWIGMGEHTEHGSTNADKPAPKAYLYPKRMPGWNLYSVNEHVHDLSVFNDAQIVWTKDKKHAWSANPETLKMIISDPTITELKEIHPGYEIWVKY